MNKNFTEQLAQSLIGQNMASHPDCLGIYIGVDEIYVSQTSRKDRGTVLESLVRVPITGVDKSQLKPVDLNEAFFTMDNWLNSLGKLMSKKKWKTNRVVVSLSPAFCLLRHFVMPATIERKEWKSAIPIQARKYIHFPYEKAAYVYYVYEFETAATKQKRLGVVFAMTTKLILERLQKGLKSVGLELVSVESSSLSLTRVFLDSDKEAVGQMGRIYSFFGSDMVHFVFLNDKAPMLLREVELSGSLPAERHRFEIANCTEFIAKQLERDPFEEAVITGTQIDQWVPALESDSKKPVRKWNLSEVYGIDMKHAGELTAVGASTKFFDTKTPDLDFTKGNRLSTYEFNACWTAWKIAAVLVVILLLMIFKGFLSVKATEHRLHKEQAGHTQAVADFAGLSANQIQANLNKIKTQNGALEPLTRSIPSMTPLLVEVVDSIPYEIWLTKISYENPFPPKNNADMRLFTLEGSIRSANNGDGRADMALGNKFKDKLLAQPIIKSICGDQPDVIKFLSVAGTTQGRELSRSSRSRGNAAAANAQETKFTFTCTKRVEGVR